MKTVGLISYDCPHLKTEQVFLQLLEKPYEYTLYLLPFTPRKPRTVRYPHRPDQTAAVHPAGIADQAGIPVVRCDTDEDIDDRCDVYLVLGAGILSPACVSGKKIINGHPGIIPASRGLDSFKWALLDGIPQGVSLHYIDEEVDAGEVIAIEETPVFRGDTFETLARRHYENEIRMMANFDMWLERRDNPFKEIPKGEAHMRMPQSKEEEMMAGFSRYVERFGK